MRHLNYKAILRSINPILLRRHSGHHEAVGLAHRIRIGHVFDLESDLTACWHTRVNDEEPYACLPDGLLGHFPGASANLDTAITFAGRDFEVAERKADFNNTTSRHCISDREAKGELGDSGHPQGV